MTFPATIPMMSRLTFDGSLERLRAIGIQRVIAVDLTRPEFGIPVVKSGDSRSRMGSQSPQLCRGSSSAASERSQPNDCHHLCRSIDCRRPVPPIAGIEWRPPVRQGDLYLAALVGPRDYRRRRRLFRNRADGLAQGNPLGHGPRHPCLRRRQYWSVAGRRAHRFRNEGYRSYLSAIPCRPTDGRRRGRSAARACARSTTCRSPTPWSMCAPRSTARSS